MKVFNEQKIEKDCFDSVQPKNIGNVILLSHHTVNAKFFDLQRLTPSNLHIRPLLRIKHSSGSAHRLTTAKEHFFLL